MSLLRIVIKRPGESAIIAEIENTLEAMQEVVGGLIERFQYIRGYSCYANEEGVLLNLEPNGPVVGTFYISQEDSEGNSVSLGLKEAADIAWSLNE